MGPIVYVIDDNFASQFATRIILEQSQIPCEVLCFEGGLEALSSFLECLKEKENIPNIILLDLNMPGIDGWEFLEKIASTGYRKEETTIYMVSTFGNANVRKRSLEHPLLKGYFERPLSIANIHEILTVDS